MSPPLLGRLPALLLPSTLGMPDYCPIKYNDNNSNTNSNSNNSNSNSNSNNNSDSDAETLSVVSIRDVLFQDFSSLPVSQLLRLPANRALLYSPRDPSLVLVSENNIVY